MASIDTAAAHGEKMSLKECEERIGTLADEIRAIKGKQKSGDVRDFPEADRNTLRKDYEQIAKLARKAAKWSKDDKDTDKYEDIAVRATKQAANLGSNLSAKHPKTTFDDVKGLEDAKNLVKSFVYMAQNRDVLNYYHLQGGLGMLMYGCPGTGKTMFAEAVAHELDLPLYIVTPADIFKPHVGESEESVRKLFDAIDEEEDGCVLFVDECESIFSVRTSDTQDYKAAVTTELLQRINGFGDDSERKGTSRIMIAATNRPDMIDKAYLRYKRFSHLVHITPPDEEAKRAIIEGTLKGIELQGITVDEIVEMTENETMRPDPSGIMKVRTSYYSAANLCGIIEEACRIAIMQIQNANSTQPIPLTREMFEQAFRVVRPGISAEELKTYENFNKEK